MNKLKKVIANVNVNPRKEIYSVFTNDHTYINDSLYRHAEELTSQNKKQSPKFLNMLLNSKMFQDLIQSEYSDFADDILETLTTEYEQGRTDVVNYLLDQIRDILTPKIEKDIQLKDESDRNIQIYQLALKFESLFAPLLESGKFNSINADTMLITNNYEDKAFTTQTQANKLCLDKLARIQTSFTNQNFPSRNLESLYTTYGELNAFQIENSHSLSNMFENIHKPENAKNIKSSIHINPNLDPRRTIEVSVPVTGIFASNDVTYDVASGTAKYSHSYNKSSETSQRAQEAIIEKLETAIAEGSKIIDNANVIEKDDHEQN